MKKITVLFVFSVLAIQCSCQEDKTFKEVVTFEKGFRFSQDGQVQTVPFTGGVTGEVSWESITGKPETFLPATHQHSYNSLTDRPSTVDLLDALKSLNVMIIEKLTTAQINARTPEAGAIVYDTTLGVLKLGTGTVWKTLITGN